jgi:uncharacterized protein YcaQ
MVADLSLAQARRIALAAQGFDGARRNDSVGTDELSSIVDRLGLIQLDSVNVAVRSHYMPFFSRLGAYDRPLAEKMAFDERRHFEYWAHAASLLPMGTHPLFRHRMRSAVPGGRAKRLIDKAPGYVDAVLEEVRDNGPLCVSDLDDPGQRMGPWWGHSDGKTALEWHFLTGAITTSTRRNFTRYYDLTERVVPSDVLAQDDIDEEDAHRQLMLLAARCHGVGTARDLADYFRIRLPDARARLRELIDSDHLREVTVEGWKEPAYLHADAADPGEIWGEKLLTPFDPLVWERDRVERLFDFRYRIEIYVPEPKRQYGYYVMPLLMDGELVARVDLKAERDRGVLRVKGAFVEKGTRSTEVAGRLADELNLMAGWLGLDRVVAGRRGNLIDDLRKSLKRSTSAGGYAGGCGLERDLR